MVFVSTSCINSRKIKDCVEKLVNEGFLNIELSGGTEYYDGLEEDLLDLQHKYKLTFICHHYFPPPKVHFAINIASLNKEIYSRSIQQIKKSIDLSRVIGSKIYGFHPGLYIDPDVKQLGRAITSKNVYDKGECKNLFIEAYMGLKKYADSKGVRLYLENMVYSKTNYEFYKENIPFMLTSMEDVFDLKKVIDFSLLFDVGHIKVSANILNKCFSEQFNKGIELSNYLHISDNDGYTDLNRAVIKESELYDELKKHNLSSKIITLEINDNIEEIKKTFKLIEKLEEV